ncbi:hypothetical protein [Cellulosimicrobium sp. NPDC057127]|uniref:hypothetical protein n=1 Tax=Cellulosimicrobium sp. NPDC057127 TaxID=3346026 RepID=UPI0036449C8F
MPPRPPRRRLRRAAPAVALAALVVAVPGCTAGIGPGGGEPDGSPSARATVSSPQAEPDATSAPGGPAPAVTPLPEFDDDSAVGDLAPGFPATVVPVAPGAQVLASSARSSDDGTRVAITLNLRSQEPVDALTTYYAQTLGAAGFTVSPATVPSALTSLTTFVRVPAPDVPAESVAVGVLDDETQRLVTISGEVVTG